MTKALIVDDHEESRYLLELQLAGQGLSVVAAANGAEALALARRDPPQIVISDILMPVMDGFTLCRAWQQDPRLAAIPFLFYTATYTDTEDEALGLRLGAARFLRKPQSPEAIASEARQVLEEAARGRTPASAEPPLPERDFSALYSAALVRKLEERTVALEEANRALTRQISDGERMRATLLESEERYRDLVEKSRALICTHDLAGNLLSVNEAAAQVTGLPHEALLGMNLRALIPPDAHAAYDAYLDEIARNGHAEGVMPLQTRGGEIRLWAYQNSLRNGEAATPVVRGMAHDVTDQLNGQRALRERNRELALLNDVAIALAGIGSAEALYRYIATALKQFSGAAAVTFGLYDAGAREIRIAHLEIDPALAQDLLPALDGLPLLESAFPVSDAIMEERIRNPIRVLGSLSEITFGTIPEAVARAAQAAHAIDRFAGIAYVFDGELHGTSVLALREGTPAPSIEMLRSFANLAAVALRRVQVEAALRESEERFRATFEQAAVGVAHVAPDGRWLRVNRRLCEIVGYDREELLAKTFQQLTHPDDLDRDLAQVRQVLAGEIASYALEKRYFRRDGTIVWINLTVSLVRTPSGEPRYFISVIEDIGERKRTEEALRLGEQRYRAFVAQSSEAIGRFELEPPVDAARPVAEQLERLYAQAVLRECNRTFAESHGYNSPGELAGARIGQLFPRLAPDNVVRLRDFIEGGHQIPAIETKEVGRDGRVVHFLGSLTGQVEAGRLLRIWSTTRDVSRIRQAEEEIRELNAGLERRVVERTAQLETANRELDAFSYSVSHDLRAPLRAVTGYTRMLVEDFGERLDDEGRRLCAVIGESARNMGLLIDELLAFSRVGRAEIESSPIDMEALARAVFHDLTPTAERERIQLRIGRLPQAQGDPSLVRQVWANLIGNAVKFSSQRERALIEIGCLPPGGPPAAVGATEAAPGETVYFIRDNGAGFDMAYRDKLFGVFQRLHSSGEFEGTGVGLAIAARIVERHGGRIWAEGEPDRGALFCFTLAGREPEPPR